MAVLCAASIKRTSPINHSNIFLMISKVNFNEVKNTGLLIFATLPDF
jgi:hypothetical protein